MLRKVVLIIFDYINVNQRADVDLKGDVDGSIIGKSLSFLLLLVARGIYN
jgi:hypothetical protein